MEKCFQLLPSLYALALLFPPKPSSHTQLRIVTLGISGGRSLPISHGAVTRRPPISLDTVVPQTGSYAYDVGVWDLSIVQGPFSSSPRAKPKSYDSQLLHRWRVGGGGEGRG
jgi:hypothetical protein